MIQFSKEILDNGLTVIVHEDQSTPLVAMNILYKVGSRDEDESKTGFAHLFEHLMFGGSVHIPTYDEPLQRAGGENNAFTCNDFTNYYLTIPSQNIDTGFWLESDRMLNLAFSEKSLEVQRNVVIEEFRQRYLNQPYGDVWLNLRPLAYKVHPYKWDTIGKEISHIETATIDDVKGFFKRYYAPDNAILSIAGDITADKAFALSKEWFGDIPEGNVQKKTLPQEPIQTEARTLTLQRKVPFNSIYKAYHCCSRFDKDYYATELLSEMLSGSKSSRLYQSLVKEQKMFSDIHAYCLGDLDKSLIVIDGKIIKGVEVEKAEEAINKELEKIKTEPIPAKELTKVKQKMEASLTFSEMNIANKALNLAYFEMLGDAGRVNEQIAKYSQVTEDDVQYQANAIFNKQNSSTLYYIANT